MKKLLLVNVLFLFCIISEAQIIQNPSLTTSQAPGSFLFPESWSKSGVAQGLIHLPIQMTFFGIFGQIHSGNLAEYLRYYKI